jgi:hypothetical protein
VDFLDRWQHVTDKAQFTFAGVPAEAHILEARRVSVVAEREGEICVAFKLPGERTYLGDLEYEGRNIRLTVKGDQLLFQFIQEIAATAFCLD